MNKAKVRILNLDKDNGWRTTHPEIIGWEGIAEYERTGKGGPWFFLAIHEEDNEDNFPIESNILSTMHVHKAQIKILKRLDK